MSRRRRRKRASDGDPERKHWGSIYPTLDLHGRTGAEAEQEAERWIEARRSDGESVVRIVTGRGLHSVGPPILPGAIEELLAHLRGKVVKKYEREPGGGAYRIQLTRRTERPASPEAITPPADPQVLREAADALAELGIASTPALLQAEVERILKERSPGAQ
jgi:DNA-nicking Smr family endonuclease